MPNKAQTNLWVTFENILTTETSQKADSSQDIPPCRTCSSARFSPSQAERTEADLFVLMPRQDHGTVLKEGAGRRKGKTGVGRGRISKMHNTVKTCLQDKDPNY